MAKSITDAELKNLLTEFIEDAIDAGNITETNCHVLQTRTDTIGKFLAKYREEYKITRPKCNAVYTETVTAQFGAAPKAKPETKPKAKETEDTVEETKEVTTEETKDDTVEEETPKPAAETPKPRRQPRTPKKSIDDLVESDEPPKPARNKAKTESVNRSSRSTQRSKLTYARCSGLSINNPSSAFNLAEPADPGAFSDEVVDVKEAEVEFLETFLPSDKVEEYNEATNEFIDAVNQLYDAYPIDDPKGKKHQHFTVVKSGMKDKERTVKVKFVDPASEKLTLAELPPDDTVAFYEHEVFMAKFANTLKEALKPPKPSKEEKEKKAKLSKEEKAALAKKNKEEY